MRRLILIAGKDPLLEIGGGHGSYVRVHARAALAAGYEPEIFCVSRSGGTVRTDYGTVHRLRSPVPIGGLPGLPRFLSWVAVHVPMLARAVAARLRSSGDDRVALVHGFGSWASAGTRLPKRRAISIASLYTVTEHEARAIVRGLGRHHRLEDRLGLRWKRWWTRSTVHRHERRACLASDEVLVNYESVRRLLGAAFGAAAAARCHRVPYSCESAFLGPSLTEPPTVSTRPHIVSLSRHDPRKGLDILLQALALLRRQGVLFSATLVGGGRLLEAHHELTRQLNLEEVVRLIGFVDDPRPWLNSADVFVLPSLEEGGGALSLLEALSAGVAVVASGIDGVPEDITDGEDGLLTPPAHPAALAGALRAVLTDASLRHRLAAAGLRTFERRFSARRLSDALADTYERSSASPDGGRR